MAQGVMGVAMAAMVSVMWIHLKIQIAALRFGGAPPAAERVLPLSYHSPAEGSMRAPRPPAPGASPETGACLFLGKAL